MKRLPMAWLLKKLQRRLLAMALMIAAYLCHALLCVVFALGTRQVINTAIGGNAEAFIRACLLQAAIIGGILLSLTLFRHMKEWLNAILDRDWKKDLLNTLLQGEYASVSAYHSGEIINRMNNDVRAVNDGLLATLPAMAGMLVRLVTAAAILYQLEPGFTAVLLILGALFALLTIFLRNYLKGIIKQVSETDGHLSGFLQEIIEKLLMVQAMDVSEEMERRADALMDRRYIHQRHRKKVGLLSNTAISIFGYAAGFAALVWCSYGLLQGRITFGDLTAVTQLVTQLQYPFTSISGMIPQYIAMVAATERLMELDSLKPYTQTRTQDPQPLYEQITALGAQDLAFAYDRNSVLSGVSFELPKGCFAVITGHSGIGKSTLLKLLLGVFEPGEGSLYLQHGAQRMPIDRSTRRLFAYVPQGNLLLSGTVRDNLLVSNPEATQEQIRQALYVSAMDAFLPQLPKGLDTVLGENGTGLSEGQAQRLAIARAVLGGAPILLLDEATSALDARTEYTVLSRIREMPEKTCIAVTHRPAAVELADLQIHVSNTGAVCRSAVEEME